ncbi:uncharacterized protein BJ212DRAFT_1301775 [Suillus subaureus]|uniref:C2H2-type domain-containing protein n=1 Tax=Suillus subaureus TaxID=48587 RepID=A0A9P7E5B6_9AGAM|nr:uncharacterized protein BJ212DRAFT_1301775 [Suillus subaureus]KAG1811734.1 hypothetical protein BJ212DRAFT_1301775 [Suillus subaureus]
MLAKYIILSLLSFILVMSFACPACNYTAVSAHGLSMHQNQWCKGLRVVSNNVMNARCECQALQPPPALHAQSEAPLLDEPSLGKANQPEFENPEPYELPVHHSPSPPPLAQASGLLNRRWQLPSHY